MSADDYAWLRELEPGEGDAAGLRRLAERLVAEGDLETAATAYDRAYGLAAQDGDIAVARGKLLDSLAVVEHGLRFRYVPAGCHSMGSYGGDPDEQPVHRVRLDEIPAFIARKRAEGCMMDVKLLLLLAGTIL